LQRLFVTFRNSTEFCVLNFYHAVLPNLFTSSKVFLVEYWGFSIYKNKTSSNGQFHFSFLIWMHFIYSFLNLILWLKLVVLRWVDVVRADIFALFLILEEKQSVSHLWVMCGFFDTWSGPKLCWSDFALSIAFWEFYEHLLNFIIYFFIWSCDFILRLCCGYHTVFHMLSHFCFPGKNPSWAWCLILLVLHCVWFNFLVL
jgi:hypothetical protein